MIRISMMLLATIMLISQAPAEKSVDACFHRRPDFTVMRLTREYLRDMVQVCSDALESPGTRCRRSRTRASARAFSLNVGLPISYLATSERALADLDESIRFLH